MSSLPPVEQPQLQTNHLPIAPTAPMASDHFTKKGFLSGLSPARFFSQFFQLPGLHRAHIGLFAVGFALPLVFLFLAQPAKPSFSKEKSQMMANYVGQQQAQQPPATDSPTPIVASAQENNQDDDFQNPDVPTPLAANADADTTAANLVSADATATDDAQLAELANSDGNKTYRYHLTVSKGFLDKAIQLSKQTADNQTAADKAKITEYIDKALESTNKAIELDATEGSGFLMRARIYQTASVLKPELEEYAQQDREIAEALGIDGTDLTGDTNPLDLLPTQQANLADAGPIVADAEEGSDSTVDSTQTNNVEQGQVTMEAGTDEVKVSFPELKSEYALRVDLADTASNPDNITFRVSSRQDGEGFTIKASSPVSDNVTLDWRAIETLE